MGPAPTKDKGMLNKANLQIAEIAAKEQSRFQISGILVTPTETVATDGHRMICVTTPANPGVEHFPETPGITPTVDFEPFILGRKDCLSIMKRLPREPTIPILGNAVVSKGDGNGVTLAINDLETATTFKAEKIKGVYPNYKKSIPEESPEYRILFGCDFLISVLRQIKDFAKEQPCPVAMEFYGPDKPMVIRKEARGQTMTALLMPVRDGETSGYLGPKELKVIPPRFSEADTPFLREVYSRPGGPPPETIRDYRAMCGVS